MLITENHHKTGLHKAKLSEMSSAILVHEFHGDNLAPKIKSLDCPSRPIRYNEKFTERDIFSTGWSRLDTGLIRFISFWGFAGHIILGAFKTDRTQHFGLSRFLPFEAGRLAGVCWVKSPGGSYPWYFGCTLHASTPSDFAKFDRFVCRFRPWGLVGGRGARCLL